MIVEALKEQARSHERRAEWADALQLYLQAIASLDSESGDAGLYNRAGDLFRRLGNLDSAVEHYQRAAELYLRTGLTENAVAILKKILRHAPDRREPWLRMGEIRAEQGFMADARMFYLAYADRSDQAGDPEEGLHALRTFAAQVPSDVDFQCLLADRLQVRGHDEEAVHLLDSARNRAYGEGKAEAVAQVEALLESTERGRRILSRPAVAAPPATDGLQIERTSLAPDSSVTAVEGEGQAAFPSVEIER